MKKTIKSAIASLMLVAALAVGIVVADPTGNIAIAACDTSQGISGGIDCANPGDSVPQSLFDQGGIFTTIVNVLLFVIGAISVIMLIIGGIRYTISGGDQTNVTAAKNTIMYALIGLVVAFLAFAIVNWVLGSLSPN